MSVQSPLNGWLGIISKYGIASAIAIYLVWQMAARLPVIEKGVTENAEGVHDLKEQHVQMKDNFDKESLRQNVQDEKIIQLLRANCLNAAESKEERLLCNL